MLHLRCIAIFVLIPAIAFASGEGHGEVDYAGFFWRIFMFAVFAVILYKLLAARVNNMLAKNVESVKESLETAEKACKDAEKELADYSTKIAGMTKDLEDLKNAARITTEKEVEMMLAEAQKTSEKYRELAKTTIEAETTKAISALKSEISLLAVKQAEDILAEQKDTKAKQAFIANSITKIGV